MERGSVEGEVFHRGAVAELSSDLVRPAVESHLATLVRKELIRSTSPMFPADEGFRFRHLLIRDAAYESLPKTSRAALHERFADWLEQHDLVEGDEIVGYHLEQAHRYRVELDPADESLADLAGRASARLRAAGRGALDRGDFSAGRTLIRRAVAILPPTDARRYALAPDLAFALWESGDLAEAAAVLADVEGAPDPVVAAIASIVATTLDLLTAGSLSADERSSRREAAREVLEAAGHDEGLGLYWWGVGGEHWFSLRAAETIVACERGIHHFRRAGAIARTEDLMWWIPSAYTLGPTPVAEALERVEALYRGAGGSILREAGSSAGRARLLAMQGDVDRARELLSASRETMRAAGMAVSAAGLSMYEGWVEHRAGDHVAREQTLRSGLAELEALDERAFASTTAMYLAMGLHEQARYEEVRELCVLGREKSAPDDVVNFIYGDALEGWLLAHEGRFDEGLALATDALARSEATDFFDIRVEIRLLVADCRIANGQADEAATVAGEALAILAAKGDVTGEARARERIAELGIRVT
jgi:hypothetical protein